MGGCGKKQACLISGTIPVPAWMKLVTLQIFPLRTVGLQRENSKAGRPKNEASLVIRFGSFEAT